MNIQGVTNFSLLRSILTFSFLVIYPARGKQLEKFAHDVMLSFGVSNAAIVINHDQMWSWENQQSAAIIWVPDIQDDARSMIGHLSDKISADEIDFIFFMSPNSSELVTLVADELGTINSKVVMLMPQGYSVSYILKLDSRLFFYKIYGISITLFEKYCIRFGQKYNFSYALL